MAVATINFSKVIEYSLRHCFTSSKSKCATYVKNAFAAGGCEYISGDGWSNQTWCRKNGFQLIGDFIPVDGNPRPHNGMPMQFPQGYVQQAGDVCLIKHGTYGHICYAMGSGINDWVSDYFQKSPVQEANTGPYCYQGNYERVQFWRHSSVMGDTTALDELPNIVTPLYNPDTIASSRGSGFSYSSSAITTINLGDNIVYKLSSSTKNKNPDLYVENEDRRSKFEALQQTLTNNAPNMGREIYLTEEMYDSNILKGGQQSTEIRT